MTPRQDRADAVAPATTLQDTLRLIEARHATLGPELQRCARWVGEHPREVGLLSMRRQAQLAGVTPTSMVRMARALGFADYNTLRRPFQDALAGPEGSFHARAHQLQATAGAGRGEVLDASLDTLLLDNVHSATALNPAQAIDAAADAMLAARRVAFLGVRSCFAISFHFHYTYGLVAPNGLLIHGLGGAFPDQVDALAPDDLLVCITQQPYGRPTIEALQACHARGVAVLALTDSPLSPASAHADHLLYYQAQSPSFFPSMLGPLALVERLLAHLAARGGQPLLDRLAEVEGRLRDNQAYWSPSRSAARSSPRAPATRKKP